MGRSLPSLPYRFRGPCRRPDYNSKSAFVHFDSRCVSVPTYIECVLFSEAGSSCTMFWTAGHRSTTNSAWEWRVTSSDANPDVVSAMTYTNWEVPGRILETDNRCVILFREWFYAWADHSCEEQWCSVCEIDL